jgi:hypothetical protein
MPAASNYLQNLREQGCEAARRDSKDCNQAAPLI